MAKVVPFRGLRYNTDKFNNLEEVTAPPYDIISLDEKKELYDKSEHNIIRVDCGLEYETDNSEDNCYTRSARYLQKWLSENALQTEEKPAFYIYEQIFALDKKDPSHSLKGIIGLVQLEEFDKKVVLPHEETISKAKEDRLNLMKTTASNISQVYSLYMDEENEIARLIDSLSDGKPDLTFVSPENVIQNVWIVTDEDVNSRITEMFKDRQVFIADGHHRYETALNYRRLRHEADGTEVGTMSYDYVMMMLVSMNNGGLFVFPTHRMVKDLENFDEILTVGFLTEDFAVSKIHFTEGDYASIITDRLANTVDETLFGLYTGQNYYYLLKFKNEKAVDEVITDKSDAYKHLDVTVLHKLILEKYMGIDEENMRDQKNLVYTRSASEAIEAVKSGKMNCAFLMNPTKVSQIRAVAKANEKMPQKSTYFWPKLVTGIVMNKFED